MRTGTSSTAASNWEDNPCPEGSFSDRDGVRDIINCQQVGYGKFGDGTDSEGYVTRAQGDRCEAGYTCYTDSDPLVYSSRANMELQLCPLGESCQGGNIHGVACAPGTYFDIDTNSAGQDTTECVSCDADYYCPYWGTRSTKFHEDTVNCCNPSNYIDGCNPCQLTCADGYICMGGAIHYDNRDEVTVKFCPAGYVCQVDETGVNATQQACLPGSYQAVEG